MTASLWDPNGTNLEANASFLNLRDYCTGDGVVDDTAGIVAAIADSLGLRKPIWGVGLFRYTSQIVVPQSVGFIGAGICSFENSAERSFSCFLKDFDGTGFLFSGNATFSDGVQYDSVAGRTGDNVQVTGTRFRSESISVTNAGQDGLRIGTASTTGTGVSPINANLFYIGRLVAYNCARYGVNIDDTNTGGAGDYPLGVPNANGGYIGLLESDRHPGTALRFGNCIDNYIASLVTQSNTGRGILFDEYARVNVIGKFYGELNATEDIRFAANAKQNMVQCGTRAVLVATTWTNLGGNSNLVITHEQGVGIDGAYNSSPWLLGPEIWARNRDAAGAAYLGAWIDAGLAAYLRINLDGTSGTKVTLVTKRDGNTVTDKLTVDAAGRVFILDPAQGIYLGSGTTFPGIFSGAGTPEGAVTARIGSIYFRTNGGAGTSLYVKESGTGNTGWIGK